MSGHEDSNPPRPMRVFISYAWDDDAHREWVARLATRLRRDGIDARLDRWHAEDGLTIPEFMNREVRAANKVLVVCSPKYRERIHEMEESGRLAGSGWESMLIGSALFTGQLERSKLVVTLGRGTWTAAAPSFLAGLDFIDLSDPRLFEPSYARLLRRLLGVGKGAPPIGPPVQVLEPDLAPLAGPHSRPVSRRPLAGRMLTLTLASLIAASLTLSVQTLARRQSREHTDWVAEKFAPPVLSLLRQADDLDTASSVYVQFVPSNPEVFRKQVLDLNKYITSYTNAYDAVITQASDWRDTINGIKSKDERLARAVQSILDYIQSPAFSGYELALVGQGDHLAQHGRLAVAWAARRNRLKPAMTELRARVRTLEDRLIADGLEAVCD